MYYIQPDTNTLSQPTDEIKEKASKAFSFFILFVLPLFLLASSLSAKPLKDVPHIREGIIAFGTADMIRKNCDHISARYFRAYRFIKGLESHARSLGYSSSEVKAYIDDREEKARLQGIARARLIEKGVNFDNPETFCTVGRAEIATQSSIGNLLRAK